MYDFKPPYFGTAYYPESWPREQIDEDLTHLLENGLNTVRIAEFAWAVMEPREGEYDFSLFREVVDKCRERGISVIMCTPSATPPSWMEHKYPEVLMTAGDKRATHGSRRLSCPTNPRFRDFCARIAEAMGREFGKDENIIGWQIDNELTVMPMGIGCTCPDCEREWHAYLRRRYGSIDALNDAWGHYTWSMQFGSFEEVDMPNGNVGLCAAHRLAWAAYKNEVYEDFCAQQAQILHRLTDAPIGTDMMPTQQLDLAGNNRVLDVVQYNHYSGPAFSAMFYDYLRTLKDRPFWVTETSACWNGGNQPMGPRKKGFCRANTLAPFAMGGEANLYWLFRSHWGGHEMAHGSVIDAWGRPLQMAEEVRGISRDLDTLRPYLTGAQVVKSGLAISFGHLPQYIADYAPMTTPGTPSDYRYALSHNVYGRINRMHYRPDVISPYADLTPYRLLITQQQYTLEEGDFLDRILPWVEAGGTWVVGPLSDIFTKDLAKYRNAPFGHLEDWTGVRRAFYAPAPVPSSWYAGDLPAGKCTDIRLSDGYVAHTDPLHYDAYEPGEGVRVLGEYVAGGDDYLPGYAAITETVRGKGRIILLGAQLDAEGYAHFIRMLAASCGIEPITEGSGNVENSLLTGPAGTLFTAIEIDGKEPGYTVLPFAATDVFDGHRYEAGERVELPPYGCLFACRAD